MAKKTTKPTAQKKPLPKADTTKAITKTKKHAGGRPKGTPDIWTPTLKAKLVGAIQLAGFTRVALHSLGLSESSFYKMLQKDPEFKAEVLQARANREMHSLQVIKGAKAWQAHAWYLERTNHKNFGRRVALHHEGNVDQTVTIKREDFAGRTIEELDVILSRIEEAETEEIKEVEIIKKEIEAS